MNEITTTPLEALRAATEMEPSLAEREPREIDLSDIPERPAGPNAVRGKFHAAFRTSLPLGSIITSIGSRDHERATRVVAVRVVPDAECAPFEAEPGWHAWNRMNGGTTYRTRSRRLDAETPGGVRLLSADGPLSWEAPLPLTLAEALAASAMTLTSVETVCSVREEHGRWVYETGTGSMLRPWGSADTREEAEVMATAIVYRAWLAGVERIMRARGGSLRWGQPIVAPAPVVVRMLDNSASNRIDSDAARRR